MSKLNLSPLCNNHIQGWLDRTSKSLPDDALPFILSSV
jgi:hypothetical protein